MNISPDFNILSLLGLIIFSFTVNTNPMYTRIANKYLSESENTISEFLEQIKNKDMLRFYIGKKTSFSIYLKMIDVKNAKNEIIKYKKEIEKDSGIIFRLIMSLFFYILLASIYRKIPENTIDKNIKIFQLFANINFIYFFIILLSLYWPTIRKLYYINLIRRRNNLIDRKLRFFS